MLNYPQIDPVIFSLGPVKVHWYGVMYVIGFAAVWFLGQKRAQQAWSPIKPEAIEDLVTNGAIGVILGFSDPTLPMIVLAVALAVSVNLLKNATRADIDTILGVLFAFIVALGIVILTGCLAFARSIAGSRTFARAVGVSVPLNATSPGALSLMLMTGSSVDAAAAGVPAVGFAAPCVATPA